MTDKKINHGETNLALFKKYTDLNAEEGVSKKEIEHVRNEIVLANMTLVNFVVNKYYAARTPAILKPELVQEGYIGLMAAINNYDYTLGFKFSAYAVWWIKQRINNFIIHNTKTIKVPAHIKIAQNKLMKQMKLEGKDLYDLADVNPSDYDITLKMLKSIQSSIASNNVISTSNTIGANSSVADGSSTIEDILSDKNTLVENLENPKDVDDMIDAMAEALFLMEEKRRNILLLRFGIIDSIPPSSSTTSVRDVYRKNNRKRKTVYGIKKAKDEKKNYVSLRDGAVDFRKMAKLMSNSGHKMNHATARNQVIKAIEDLLRHCSYTMNTGLTKTQIKQISNDQRFQNNLQDVLHLAHEKYLILKQQQEEENENNNVHEQQQ